MQLLLAAMPLLKPVHVLTTVPVCLPVRPADDDGKVKKAGAGMDQYNRWVGLIV
jgi:hypothetical protein